MIGTHGVESASANLTESKVASTEPTHPFAGASFVSITTSSWFS